MALRDAIASLSGTQSQNEFTVTRKLVGAYDEATGVYAPGALSTFTVVGSLQASSGRDLQSLPEGERTTESRTLYTRMILRTRTPLCDPDVVTIVDPDTGLSEAWVVKSVPTHDAFGDSHCVAVLQRQGAI